MDERSEKLLLDAGAPVGAYTNLRVSHEQSNLIIDDPRVKGDVVCVISGGNIDAAAFIQALQGRIPDAGPALQAA